MYNGRPLGRKKTVQLMVLLTLLAWATQTLFHQWGYGQEIETDGTRVEMPAEKFVPGTARFAAGATLELRSEATVVGAEVRLRQVCRWSDQDAAVFAPVKDLVLFRLDTRRPYRALDVEELKNTLHDAGVNLAVIKISGPLTCMVSRSDVHVDERTALDQWIAARQGGDASQDPHDTAATTRPVLQPMTAIVAGERQLPTGERQLPAGERPLAAADEAKAAAGQEEASPVRSLRSLLTQDLAERLSLPADSLQMAFRPQDEKVLNLAEPQFQFQIQPRRVRNLGDVSWDVTILAGGQQGTQKVTIAATARAWQQQVVVMKPLAYKQVIRAEDLVSRRTLVDHLDDEVLLSADQIVGQQTALQLKAGSIVTARMVEAVPLVRNGHW